VEKLNCTDLALIADQSDKVEEPIATISCVICDRSMDVRDMKDHVLNEHMSEERCSIRVCRIEKCEKCINDNDGLVIHHYKDDDDEILPGIDDYNVMYNKSLVTLYTGVQL